MRRWWSLPWLTDITQDDVVKGFHSYLLTSLIANKSVSVYKLRVVFVTIHEMWKKTVIVLSNFMNHNSNNMRFINGHLYNRSKKQKQKFAALILDS